MVTFSDLTAARNAIRHAKTTRNDLLASMVGMRITWIKNGNECCGHVIRVAGERLRVKNMETLYQYWIYDFDVTGIEDKQ